MTTATPNPSANRVPDRPSANPDPTESVLPDTNLVVLSGRLSSDPVVTDLPSGSVLYSWSVKVAAGSGRATSVPVVAIDPARSARARRAGDAVVVAGSVRRRFFGAGGNTQSRTEVVATQLHSAGSAKAVGRLLAAASATLSALT